MKISLKSSLLVFLCLLTSSCATVLSGTTQSISVQAVDETTNTVIEGISCSVADGKGVIYPVPTNPGTITVSKGKGDLSPKCIKKGYTQTNFGVGESFNGVTLVNILFWPGFIVDGMSGAMQDYPSHISVFMRKN
jgi:hypothetical protein